MCTDLDTGGHSCVTGLAVFQLTITPSGAASGTLIDNGRYEILDATGCTTTGSFQLSDHLSRANPDQSANIVQRTANRTPGKTRCRPDPRLPVLDPDVGPCTGHRRRVPGAVGGPGQLRPPA
jgi:hypothetical protein